MSIFHYLQLQPVDPHKDGSVSDLDEFAADEKIDLNEDIDEQALDAAWDKVLKDLKKDPHKLKFTDED